MLEICQWRAGKQRMDFTEGKSAVGGGNHRDGQGQVGCCQRLPENHTSHLAFHPPARCLGLDTVSTPCTAIRAIPWRHHGEKNNHSNIVTVSYTLINPLHPTCEFPSRACFSFSKSAKYPYTLSMNVTAASKFRLINVMFLLSLVSWNDPGEELLQNLPMTNRR